MAAYILRRVIQIIPTLFGVMILVFTLFNWVGGDPAYLLAGKHLTADTLALIRAQLGLDKSLAEQFFIFAKQVLTLDFGTSWSTQQPVSEIIQARLGPSLMLSGSLLLINIALAIPIALIVVYYHNTLTDRLVTLICTLTMSVSVLVYIILGQYWLAYRLGWFPIRGWEESFFTNLFVYLPLPLLMGLCVSLGPDIRLYRSFILEEISQDYVRTARAKGLSETFIMLKHVLRNAMIPIVTTIMMSLPSLLMGAMVIESFFGIPGIGNEIVNAVDKSDFPVIKAITIYVALATVTFNLLTDLIYHWIDPRVRFN